MIISAEAGRAIALGLMFVMGLVTGWMFAQQCAAATIVEPVKPVNNEWLDVAMNGKIVEINSKGKTRRKKKS